MAVFLYRFRFEVQTTKLISGEFSIFLNYQLVSGIFVYVKIIKHRIEKIEKPYIEKSGLLCICLKTVFCLPNFFALNFVLSLIAEYFPGKKKLISNL